MYTQPAIEIELPARANGRHPRVETLDLIAVERVLDQRADPATLTPAERREAVRQALERGWGWQTARERLRVATQTIRQALDEPIALIPA